MGGLSKRIADLPTDLQGEVYRAVFSGHVLPELLGRKAVKRVFGTWEYARDDWFRDRDDGWSTDEEITSFWWEVVMRHTGLRHREYPLYRPSWTTLGRVIQQVKIHSNMMWWPMQFAC